MTVNDPTSRTTEVRTTYGSTIPDPTVIHTTEVRDSSAAWWIGALVAIVAILAVVFLVTRSPTTDDATVANAVEQGRLQGTLDAQSSINAAQDSANYAAQSANMAAQRSADATTAAANDARAAANRAADAAASASSRVDTVIVPVAPAPVP